MGILDISKPETITNVNALEPTPGIGPETLYLPSTRSTN